MTTGDDTKQCSRCHKRFFEDGFKVNRFGHRHKTCLECSKGARHNKVSRRTGRTIVTKNDAWRIGEEAYEHGFELLKPEAYVNSHLKVGWACLICHHTFITAWRTLATTTNFRCDGFFHRAPALYQKWLELAEEHGLDPNKPQANMQTVTECMRHINEQMKADHTKRQVEPIPPPVETAKAPQLTDDEVTSLLVEFGF